MGIMNVLGGRARVDTSAIGLGATVTEVHRHTREHRRLYKWLDAGRDATDIDKICGYDLDEVARDAGVPVRETREADFTFRERIVQTLCAPPGSRPGSWQSRQAAAIAPAAPAAPDAAVGDVAVDALAFALFRTDPRVIARIRMVSDIPSTLTRRLGKDVVSDWARYTVNLEKAWKQDLEPAFKADAFQRALAMQTTPSWVDLLLPTEPESHGQRRR